MTTENDCPICFDTITLATGSVILGCSHRYHLKCIITWSLESETCPCCRKVLNNYERVGDVLPEIPSSGSRRMPAWPVEDPWADLPDSVLSDMLDRIEADAATKIAAVARGFLTRHRLNRIS